jgi:nucleotide-binding universal stress UspA family protein
VSLVCGTDLTVDAESDRVARLAGRMAAAAGTELRLVHVSTDPRAPFVLGTPEEALLADTRRALEQLAAAVRAAAGARVEVDLWAGDVAEGLAGAAEMVLAPLLLLSEVGRRRPHRLLGSTVERLLRRSRVPVLVVREVDRLEGWVAGDRALRVLVGSDTGEAATRAMRFVQGLGDFGPLAATVACVADPTAVSRRYSLPEGGTDDAMTTEAEALLRRELEAQAARAGLAEAQVEIHPSAAAAEAQLAVIAEQHGADVVAVGVRARSYIEEIWYGSVAHGVVRGVSTNLACVPRTLVEEVEPARPLPRDVVVATDLSPVGDVALPVAYGFVADGGTVHAVHIMDAQRIPVPGRVVSPSDADRRLRARIPAGAAERRIRTEVHVLSGEVASAIVALAERVRAGAICIGSRGYGPVGSAVLGSVSREVVAKARCPVIVVPVPRE